MNILYSIWPPFELIKINKKIDDNFDRMDFDEITSQIDSKLFEKNKEDKEIQEYVKIIFESENKRKDSLEAKALQYFSAYSLSTTIFSFLPIVLANHNSIPKIIAAILSSLYLFTLLHFIVAVFESLNARKIGGFALPCVDDIMNRDTTIPFRKDSFLLVKAKYNENILLKKANYITVSEVMFSRGVFLFLLTITILLVTISNI